MKVATGESAPLREDGESHSVVFAEKRDSGLTEIPGVVAAPCCIDGCQYGKATPEPQTPDTPNHEWVGASMHEATCRKCGISHAEFRGTGTDCLWQTPDTQALRARVEKALQEVVTMEFAAALSSDRRWLHQHGDLLRDILASLPAQEGEKPDV